MHRPTKRRIFFYGPQLQFFRFCGRRYCFERYWAAKHWMPCGSWTSITSACMAGLDFATESSASCRRPSTIARLSSRTKRIDCANAQARDTGHRHRLMAATGKARTAAMAGHDR